MSSTIKTLTKLGLGGAYQTSTINNFTDRTPQNASNLKKVVFDVENVGNLKNIKPRGILTRNVSLGESSFNYKFSTKAVWKLPIQDEKYYFSKYTITAPTLDILGLVHFGLQSYRPEDNSYYRKDLDLLNKFKYTEDPFRHEEAFSRVPWKKLKPLDANNSYQKSGTYRPSGFARNDLDFARVSFPDTPLHSTGTLKVALLNTTNTDLNFSECPLTGYASLRLDPENLSGINTFFNTGVSGANIKASLNRFEKSLYSKTYLYANNSVISNLNSGYFDISVDANGNPNSQFRNTGNYSNYLIPYPITIDKQNFYKFNIPTKIAVYDNYDDLRVRGLIVVSTGDPLNGIQKICYVSPHIIVPKLVNVVEDFIVKEKYMQKRSGINRQTNRLKHKTEIFQANILSLTSETEPNMNGNIYGPGLQKQYINYQDPSLVSTGRLSQVLSGSPLLITNNTVFSRPRIFCVNSGHLMQTVPLSQTPFYNFYKDIYTGTKTFNTGTWDGIVPTGVFINIELITTTLGNNYYGCDRNLVIVYSGQGNMDNIDRGLYKNLNQASYKNLYPTIDIKNQQFSFTKGSSSFGANASILSAKVAARQKINKMITRALKYTNINIMGENRKTRRFKKYLNRIQNKQVNQNALINVSEYVSNIEGVTQ